MTLARLILGLLNLSPMTGYDLKKHFDSSISHFWNADKAQIYRTLARLVEDGLATVRTVPQPNYPDRQEHHITDAGRAALREWLAGPLDHRAGREPFLARVFCSGELPRAEVLSLLSGRRHALGAALADYREQSEAIGDAAGHDRRSFLMAATLENGIRRAEAELAWLDDVERRLP